MKNQIKKFISADIEITKNLFLLGACYFKQNSFLVKKEIKYSQINYVPSDIFDEEFYIKFNSILKLDKLHQDDTYLLAYNGSGYDFPILLAILKNKEYLCDNKIKIVDFILSLSAEIIEKKKSKYSELLKAIMFSGIVEEIYKKNNILLCDPKNLIAVSEQVSLKSYMLHSEGILESFDFDMSLENMIKYNKQDCVYCLKYLLDAKHGSYGFFQTHNSRLFKGNIKRLYSSSASVSITFLCEKLDRKYIGFFKNKKYSFTDILCTNWVNKYTQDTKNLISILNNKININVEDGEINLIDENGEKINKKTFSFLGYNQAVGFGGLHLRPCEEESSNPIFLYPEMECVRYKNTLTIDKHSTEKTAIINSDVSSYYPNLILSLHSSGQDLEVGDKKTTQSFVNVFSEILKQRMELKKKKDKTEDEKALINGLKLVLNSTFGRLKYKYSKIKSIYALLSITLNGQFLILNLISELHNRFSNFKIIFVNTDGLAFTCNTEDKDKIIAYIDSYMKEYMFQMEHEELSRLLIANVNGYAFYKDKVCIKKKGRALSRTKNQPACISDLKDLYISDKKTFEAVDINYFKNIPKKNLVLQTKVTSPLILSDASSNDSSLDPKTWSTRVSAYFVPVISNGTNLYRINTERETYASVNLAKQVKVLDTLEDIEYENLDINFYKDMVIRDLNLEGIQKIIKRKVKDSSGLLLRGNVYDTKFCEEITLARLKTFVKNGEISIKIGTLKKTIYLEDDKLKSYRIQAGIYSKESGLQIGISQYLILDIDDKANIISDLENLKGICMYFKTPNGYRAIVKLDRFTNSISEYSHYYKKCNIKGLDGTSIKKPLTLYMDKDIATKKTPPVEMTDVIKEVELCKNEAGKEGIRRLCEYVINRYTPNKRCAYLYENFKRELNFLQTCRYETEAMRRYWGALYLQDYLLLASKLEIKRIKVFKIKLESLFLEYCQQWTNKGEQVGYEEGIRLLKYLNYNPTSIKMQTFKKLFNEREKIETAHDDMSKAIQITENKDNKFLCKDTQILSGCNTGKTLYMTNLVLERDKEKQPSCVILPTKKDGIQFAKSMKKHKRDYLYLKRSTKLEDIKESSSNIYITHLPYGLCKIDGSQFGIIRELEEKFPADPKIKLRFFIDEVHQHFARKTVTFQMGHRYKFAWKGSIVCEEGIGKPYIFMEFVKHEYTLKTLKLEGYSKEDLDALSIEPNKIFHTIILRKKLDVNGVSKAIAKGCLTSDEVIDLLLEYSEKMDLYIENIIDPEKKKVFLELRVKLYPAYKILLNLLVHNPVNEIHILNVTKECRQSIYKGLHLQVLYYNGYNRKAIGFSATRIKDILWDVIEIPSENKFSDTNFNITLRDATDNKNIEDLHNDEHTEEEDSNGLVVCSTFHRAKQLAFENQSLVLCKGILYEVDSELELIEDNKLEDEELCNLDSAIAEKGKIFSFFYSSDMEASNMFVNVKNIYIEPQFKPQRCYIKDIRSEQDDIRQLVREGLLSRLEQVLGRFVRNSNTIKEKNITLYIKDSSKELIQGYNFKVIKNNAKNVNIINKTRSI